MLPRWEQTRLVLAHIVSNPCDCCYDSCQLTYGVFCTSGTRFSTTCQDTSRAGLLIESNNIVKSRRRENRGLKLHFVVPSAVKKRRVQVARNGPLFGRFGVRMTLEPFTAVLVAGRGHVC